MLSIFSSSQMWPRYLPLIQMVYVYSFSNNPVARSKQTTTLDVVLATIHWLSFERETEQIGTVDKWPLIETYFLSSLHRAFQLEYHMFGSLRRHIYVTENRVRYPVTIDTSSTHKDVILSVASLSVWIHWELCDLYINNQSYSLPCIPELDCCIITTRSKYRTVFIVW